MENIPSDNLSLTESRAVSLHFASHIIGASLTQSSNRPNPAYPLLYSVEQKTSALSTIFSNLCKSFSADETAESSQTSTILLVTSSIITEHKICNRSAGSFRAKKVNTVARSLKRDSMPPSVSPSSVRASLI